MTAQYTVSQSAKRLGISVSNLKRTADDFHNVLPDYEPSKGKRRTFSEGDLLTISAVLTRLSERKNQTRADVIAELSETGSEPLIIPDNIPDRTTTERPERHEADLAIVEGIAPLESVLAPVLQAHADTQRQLAELSATISELKAERPRNAQERRYPVAVTLAFALLLGGAALAVLLQTSEAMLIAGILALCVLGGVLVWPSLRR